MSDPSDILGYRNLLVPFSASIPAFRDGTDTPRHYLERCLEAISERDPDIKAFVCLNLAGARRAADDASVRYRSYRPLSSADGMPIGVKDIIDTRDLPTEMNSPIFSGFQPRRDAACVAVLKNAGAVVVGKTATAEFACGRSPETRNPHDLSRTPGGSSSGSAAAVGGGMIPGALGTQTQASMLRPASYCGCFAMKPSLGALSIDGVAPLSPTLDHLGLFGASIEDLWTMLATAGATGMAQKAASFGLAGPLPDASKPATLIRLNTKGWGETDDVTHIAFENAVATLSTNGVKVIGAKDSVDIATLEQDLLKADAAAALIYAVEAQWPLRAYEACGERTVGARIYELLAAAEGASESQYHAALELRSRIIQRLGEFSAQADGYITLSSSGPAVRDIAYTGSRSFAVLWTLLGAPSLSLPVLSSGALPVGMQMMGAYGEDLKTFRIARWISAMLLDQTAGDRR